MLDPHQPVELPGIPVRAFRDDRRPQAFYLMPLEPTIARDEYGQPSVNLTVYGRHVNSQFQAQGGVFTLTTALEVGRAVEQQARAALAHWLAGQMDEAPPIEILAIEWLSGEVSARLTAQLTLSGRPSLTSPNSCAFNERIGRDAIGALVDAWRGGLPDSRITYSLRARTAASATATSQTGEGTPFTFEGPLDLDRDALGGAMTTTNL
jgi:hypothetical protein